MNVPTAVAKFCCAEAASVAAVDAGSTVLASMTFGFVTSRNFCEQAEALARSAAPMNMFLVRETARRVVIMIVS
jgi:hypothetical protein